MAGDTRSATFLLDRQLPNRQGLQPTVTADNFEQLHSRHSFSHRPSLGNSNVGLGVREWGQIKPSLLL